MPRFALLVATALVLLACGDATPVAQQLGEARDIVVQPAEIGGSYRVSVVPAHGAEATSEHVSLLRFRAPAGVAFAAVMRRLDGDPLDAYLALYRGERSEGAIAVSDLGQALVPMAGEEDAVLVYRPEHDAELLLFAADRDLDATAAFQIDLVALEGELAPGVTLTLTNPALRMLHADLREREPELRALMALGAIREAGDGSVTAQPSALPLGERAALAAFASNLNEARAVFLREHARAARGDEDPALAAELGRLCATLWSALRSDAHAL